MNKHILEAINKGIKLALDDYQDIEKSSIPSSNNIINVKDDIQYRIILNTYTVDLGLPSGTRWCKYNLGCNYDLLNKTPGQTSPKDWYGDYYAWGEIDPNKSFYGWKESEWYIDFYKWSDGTEDTLTKYCNNHNYGYRGYMDKLTTLLPEDDAAYQNMQNENLKFCMPTKEQFEELIENTMNGPIQNYEINGKKIMGLNGGLFKGQNGNELFIPMAGNYENEKLLDTGVSGSAWTSELNLDNPSNAYYFDFSQDHIDVYDTIRCSGLSIRPLLNLKQ